MYNQTEKERYEETSNQIDNLMKLIEHEDESHEYNYEYPEQKYEELGPESSESSESLPIKSDSDNDVFEPIKSHDVFEPNEQSDYFINPIQKKKVRFDINQTQGLINHQTQTEVITPTEI